MTAGALPERIWVHRPGSLAAIRVTSRTPCPARPIACSLRCSSRAATSEAATCGTCETAATATSWSSGLRVVTAAPTARARRPTSSVARESACSWGQSTQARPSKRSARPLIAPDRSRPAIGWEPTYRSSGTPALTRSARITCLTEVTSVTTASGHRSRASRTRPGVTSGGAATTTTPGATSPVIRPAPRSRASATEVSDWSARETSTSTARSASPMLVPMSPVPMTCTDGRPAAAPFASVEAVTARRPCTAGRSRPGSAGASARTSSSRG